jgi:hypothetical protein
MTTLSGRTAIKNGMVGLLSIATMISGSLAQPNRTVIGRWRSLETSRGGIGAIVTFHEDGRFEFSPAAVVQSRYRRDGNRLILPPGTINGPEQIYVIESVTAEKMRMRMRGRTDDITFSVEFMREGKVENTEDLVLGTWLPEQNSTSRGDDNRRGLWQYRKDGTALLIAPFRTDRGSYKIDGNQMRLEIKGRPSVKGKFRWEGNDVLVIPQLGSNGQLRVERY